jgi:hypothetical protein
MSTYLEKAAEIWGSMTPSGTIPSMHRGVNEVYQSKKPERDIKNTANRAKIPRFDSKAVP